MVLSSISNLSYHRSIKERKRLNKLAYQRFKRSTAMQAKKTAARFTSLAAVEAILILLFFCLI